ncbi:hypothetical protein Hanom_Chr06g00538701 [Helianthus anomalus]
MCTPQLGHIFKDLIKGYWILSLPTIGLWPLPPPTNTLTPNTPNLTFSLCWHHSVKSLLTEFVSYPTWHTLDEIDRIMWRLT